MGEGVRVTVCVCAVVPAGGGGVDCRQQSEGGGGLAGREGG